MGAPSPTPVTSSLLKRTLMVSRNSLDDMVVVHVCRSFSRVTLVSHVQDPRAAADGGRLPSLTRAKPAPAAPVLLNHWRRFIAPPTLNSGAPVIPHNGSERAGQTS